MTVHLVGGFLGSGKTTAIRSACELRRRGESASVITNDQGTLLIDTAFLRGSHPTREMTGGCFCCRCDVLVELLAEAWRDSAQHVFAEAVGSCADLVATVVQPLLGSTSGSVDRVWFTAMVDAPLLIRLRAGEPLPWSGDVAHLFPEQLREALVLVASKWDLVTDPPSPSAFGNGSDILMAGQAVLFQDGRTPAGVTGWVDALCDPGHPATAAAGACELGIDYVRYGAREEALAWLDAEVRVDSAEGGARKAAGHLVRTVVAEVIDDADAIGHVKFLIRDHCTRSRSATQPQTKHPTKRYLTSCANSTGSATAGSTWSSTRMPKSTRTPAADPRTSRLGACRRADLAIIRSAAFHPEPPQPPRVATL